MNTLFPPEVPADSRDILELALDLGKALQARNWRVATAESCTGGGISAAITEVPGSSAWFEYGLVTYANRAKVSLLGVSAESLSRDGAVSESVVMEMAQGALRVSGADLAVSVSGVAGPDGGSSDKPVGTVWIGWARRTGENVVVDATCHHFEGDRRGVREQVVAAALRQLLALAGDSRNTV
ncbi:CinA family protein [Marinimicrobium sp. ARAG 43.8]|uniref:CinA family protein n=1 Tax=Marinimicrobium sp. ARAG 43.8 TaxID=3418719 RepID=UPI003CE956CF